MGVDVRWTYLVEDQTQMRIADQIYILLVCGVWVWRLHKNLGRGGLKCTCSNLFSDGLLWSAIIGPWWHHHAATWLVDDIMDWGWLTEVYHHWSWDSHSTLDPPSDRTCVVHDDLCLWCNPMLLPWWCDVIIPMLILSCMHAFFLGQSYSVRTGIPGLVCSGWFMLPN